MKNRGLTLIEVMVALVIFALTATAILKASSDHLIGVGQIEEITLATWVANNRLTQLHLEAGWPPKNNQKGSQEMSDRTWYWQQQVSATNDPDLRQVEVTVGLDPDYQSTITSVSSYFSNPEPGGS